MKRKATDTLTKTARKKTAAQIPVQQQVSAFAAAKARVSASTEDRDDDGEREDEEDVNDITERSILDNENRAASIESTALASYPTSIDSTLRNVLDDRSSALLSSPPRDVRIRSILNGSTEIVLAQGAFTTILGEYQLEVTSGAVTLYGATIHARSGAQVVYAPSTHALPQITARSAGTAIRISPVISQLSKLARLSTLFRNIAAPDDRDSSYLVLNQSVAEALPRILAPLDTSKQYQNILTQLTMKVESSQYGLSIACIGGKSSGKSTFVRHVCNKLVSRTSKSCYFLDIDPGQPEFGPPGQIYLVEVSSAILGPPYTHFASKTNVSYRLVAAHTIAAITPKDSLQRYMDCVRHLFEHKELSVARGQGVPVVVNTCGWVTGIGADIIMNTVHLGISDAVTIDVADTGISQAIQQRCENRYELSKPSTKQPSRTPGELRQMHTMAYFHSATRTADLEISGDSVDERRPWHLQYAGGGHNAIGAIISYGQPLGTTHLKELLDGSVVAMVAIEDNIADSLPVTRSTEGLPCLHLQQPVEPGKWSFKGLALVRAIDTRVQQLHLLVNLPDHEMAQLLQGKIVLVRGAFDSPDWAYLEALHSTPEKLAAHVRPWVARRERTGVEGAVWRLRHPPTAAQAYQT